MLEPNISFVVAARNDNYGGNFLHRMQVFLKCLLTLWQQCELSGELIIVEWNPPQGAPLLAEALSWPPTVPPGRVRIIEVPKALHRHLPNSDRIAMFEYIAKNVGVRRAKGQHVLATNPDIIFSKELMEFLASGQLSSNAFYRVDRHDVGAPVPLGLEVAEQLRFCEENVVRIRTRAGTFPTKILDPQNRRVYRGYLDKARSPKAMLRWVMSQFFLKVHTGGPGDFTLMAREHWHALRGYPELPTQRHIDSYICFMAKAIGLSQVVLKSPLRIYHQEHEVAEMFGRPATDYDLYWGYVTRMGRSKKPIFLNDGNWGLASEQLVEHVIG